MNRTKWKKDSIYVGITLVVISIAIVVFLLLISGGSAQKLMKEMIEKTLEQIKLKII